ncbi:MAG: ABC transporter substrate-binding protein [Acidimicrobiales bacterium]
MKHGRSARAGVLACLLGLSAAACGSDGGSEESAATTANSATSAAAGAVTGGDEPSTWGVKDKKLIGPSGFSADLSTCPSKWSDTAGLSNNEIRLGQSLAQSGSAAAYGQIGEGMKAYFAHINAAEGGVAGKKIVYTNKDDGYEAARGKANVDEMLETGDLFAFASNLGTPINMATADKVNESCIPDMFVASAHAAWADPTNKPWVFPVPQIGYASEGLVWGQYVVDTLGKGASVAALVVNNEFGLAYRNSFDKFAKANGLTVKYELHDPAAASITNEMTSLASTGANAVILMTLGNYCTQGEIYVGQSSWKPQVKLISNTCNTVQFFKPAGAAGDGWVSVTDRYDVGDPDAQKVKSVQEARDGLAKAGLDQNNFNQGIGWGQYGWSIVDVLKRASALSGGLTRTNVLLAARKVKMQHPFVRDGIVYEMNGNKDSNPIEGGVLARYTVEAGKDVGTNVAFGKPIDLNGQTPNCAWDGKQCKDY